MTKFTTCSSRATVKLGAAWAQTLSDNKSHHGPKRALVIALAGDLGSGKTTFIQGFLRALGVRGRLTSPTFVLMKKYVLRKRNWKRAFHLDFYRLQQHAQLGPLDFAALLADPQNIVLIEWADRLPRALPSRQTVWLRFHHGQREHERAIEIGGRRLSKLEISN
ncbi:MAG: tRNA (adenosine(37)-N6)-threonylcarbamoyltransferase complex ATPase subunit type 1 TsaE [Candidatus Liptonbacteria bacterium]|nr:tRNA (adenosine(37)-N6)-threonylcarbamoyltransferase complex ATPase subunit type 1 TsaE [Candidatus Liptonbacteria bacterium]